MRGFDTGGHRDRERRSTDASTIDSSLSRRRFLGATGAAAVVTGSAGCSKATQQSFEAAPVILPDAAQEEFVVAETARDSETITREGPTGNVEVSITNHASVYQRGPGLVASRPETGTDAVILLEKFTSRVNETNGPGAAIFVSGSEFVHDGDFVLRPAFVHDGDFVIELDQVGLILPAGARGDDGITPGQTVMVVRPAPTASDFPEKITYVGDGPGAFLPSGGEATNTSQSPAPEVGGLLQEIMVPEVEIMMDRAGVDELPKEAELIEPGEEIETEGTMFLGPTDVMVQNNPTPSQASRDIYDTGVSLYGGGSTFGLGALTTPDASVGGESANPIVGMETEELLQSGAGRRMLARAGLTDADEVEWVAGPKTFDPDGPAVRYPEPTLVGEETIPETFGGVVSGEDGPWGIVVSIARRTDDDHIIAASVIRRPVATPDGGMDGLRENMSPEVGSEFITDMESNEVPWQAVNRLERV